MVTPLIPDVVAKAQTDLESVLADVRALVAENEQLKRSILQLEVERDGAKDERYYHSDGSLKWGTPVNVQHLILQLQTIAPDTKVSSVTFIETMGGRKAKACGLSMSNERWDASGWLNFRLPGPKCLALWASQPEKIDGVNGPGQVEEAPNA